MKHYRWYTVRFRLTNGNAIDVIAGGTSKQNAYDVATWILWKNHGIGSERVRSKVMRWLRRGVVAA